MTRSRKRKLMRSQLIWAGMPIASAMMTVPTVGSAQQAGNLPSDVLQEVVVTAQKRQESLQDVPLSIQAFGTAKLEEMHVGSFDDYVSLLSSVSYQTLGPGFAQIYMRGVSSGGDGNHSGPLPSVGMYLDEQPITTIQGPLDIHIYDIARIESLAGPQGTLYGASSQAGTIRIITNKPDPSGFKAGYDLEGNTVSHGDQGYAAEGFVNLPISENAAVRLVGWAEHQAGYINNVHATRTYVGTADLVPITIDNANPNRIKDRYNDVDIYGGRAALKIDLSDTWTVTPTVMGQHTKANGIFAFDPKVGDLSVAHYYPEYSEDNWVQASLTVEGKVSNFDLVYTGAYMKRHDSVFSDYTDYSLAYDAYSYYFLDDAGNQINPSQQVRGKDYYKMYSHELRLSSPQDWRFRFVAGLFMQRQTHDIEQQYVIDGLATSLSVAGWPDTWWLTEEQRINRDFAAFTEMNFDLTPNITLTGGIRFFKAKNSLNGFYGFGLDAPYSSGEKQCIAGLTPVNQGPCVNLPNKKVDESGNTPKLGVSYKFDADRMIYATWSKGFRPGGVNRVGVLPPYTSDFLTSYELGWKTSWLNNRLRFNGAIFRENWKDFQFGFLAPGSNSVTQIANAGTARINGLEAQVDWAIGRGVTLSGGLSFIDSKLTDNYCASLDANGNRQTETCFDADGLAQDFAAPGGQQLPVTPKFKGNVAIRYVFGLGDMEGHVQSAFTYQSNAQSDLRSVEREILGVQAAYSTVSLSAGIEKGSYSLELFASNLLDKRADIYRYAECTEALCGPIAVYHGTIAPRTIGIKFGQKF
jgi:iron complex outermembrane recepter protein